ncbi:MAG: DUF4199 domain-containing protein [Prevotella sp.]|nr:DUF4199 domain-containing protein [Prevotella sp.]
MIKKEDLAQLKAFARQDGFFLSLIWIASFAFIVASPGSLMGNLLAFLTPFFVGWRLCKFRDYALDGVISMRRGLAYSFYTFVYASLVFALAQFIYFRYLDQGRFFGMLNESMNTIGPIYEKYGISTQEMKQTIDMMGSMSPIQWAFTFMMQNFVVGFFLSIPISAICARKANIIRNS